MFQRTMALMSLGVLCAACGCGTSQPVRPVSAEMFYRPPDTHRAELTEPDESPPLTPGATRSTTPGRMNGGIAPAVLAAIPEPVRPGVIGGDAATTQPTVDGPMMVGGVLAVVGQTPIFANTILEQLDPLFRARAVEMNERQFMTMAESELGRQLQATIRAEIEFAAAERELDESDRRRARLETMNWRQRQITQAGGSIAQARAAAAAEGQDFDRMVEERYRLNLVRLYYQKRVFPLVSVSASDIRAYYQANLKTEFTQPGSVQIRMIRINARQAGSTDRARERAMQLRAEIVEGGKDFVTMARQFNHDPNLARLGGEVGSFVPGTFRWPQVEQAVMGLGVGQVSEPIAVDDDFFLVQLVSRTDPRVIPFDEPGVQTRIRQTLEQRQTAAMREAAQQRLEREQQGAILINEDMRQILLELVRQNYPRYAAARGQP